MHFFPWPVVRARQGFLQWRTLWSRSSRFVFLLLGAVPVIWRLSCTWGMYVVLLLHLVWRRHVSLATEKQQCDVGVLGLLLLFTWSSAYCVRASSLLIIGTIHRFLTCNRNARWEPNILLVLFLNLSISSNSPSWFLKVNNFSIFMMLIVVKNKILWTASAEGVLEEVGKGYQLPLIMPVATSDPFLDLF